MKRREILATLEAFEEAADGEFDDNYMCFAARAAGQKLHPDTDGWENRKAFEKVLDTHGVSHSGFLDHMPAIADDWNDPHNYVPIVNTSREVRNDARHFFLLLLLESGVYR